MTDHWDIEKSYDVAWGEMDAFRHVNHTVYLRWFENIRTSWFEKVAFPEKDDAFGPILRTASAEYLRAVVYPDTVTVRARVARLGTSSVTLAYEVTSAAQQGALVARGETVIVLADYAKGASMPIPSDCRLRIQPAGTPGS